MNYERTPQGRLKGWHTYYGSESIGYERYGLTLMTGYEDAMPQFDSQGNRWASTEYNQNNSWNCNFGNGYYWANNKYNTLSVRPVVAYDTPTDFLNLVLEAFEDCCNHKGTSAECIAYCEIANQDLITLAHELYTGTYKIGTSTCFLVKYPKYREVFAACFRDRIVHHFLILLLNPYFEKRFNEMGNVSYNCRKGFGTIAAQNSVMKSIKECTQSYQEDAWVYRGDIVSFYMSINKKLLWEKLEPFIRTNYKGKYISQVLQTAKTIVFHCPENNCVFNTDINEWMKHIPRDKSLFGNGDLMGMPIGNLTTQVFANFFMSFFDEFVMKWFSNKGVKFGYSRFVDDFVVVCSSNNLLKLFIREANDFLVDNLSLRLHHDKYHFQKASHGVLFVGAYVKNGRMYLSNRTIARLTERVYGFRRILLNKSFVTLADVLRMEQVLNSYLGMCKGKRTYAIRKNLLGCFFSEFYKYFYIRGHYDSIHVKNKHKIAI